MERAVGGMAGSGRPPASRAAAIHQAILPATAQHRTFELLLQPLCQRGRALPAAGRGALAAAAATAARGAAATLPALCGRLEGGLALALPLLHARGLARGLRRRRARRLLLLAEKVLARLELQVDLGGLLRRREGRVVLLLAHLHAIQD